MEGPENQATRPISITPRSRQRRGGRGQEEMPVMSQSVPTTFYSNNANLVVPRAPLLTSQSTSRAPPPSNLILPPSPDFSGEHLEKFAGGRSLTTSRSEFPSSVPASFLSNRMQKLNINRKNKNSIQISRKKPVATEEQNEDSPSSSIHSGGRAAEETEPPAFGSFTCFQILEEDSNRKRPATQIQGGVFDGFSLGDQDETTVMADTDALDDDDLQFNFD